VPVFLVAIDLLDRFLYGVQLAVLLNPTSVVPPFCWRLCLARPTGLNKLAPGMVGAPNSNNTRCFTPLAVTGIAVSLRYITQAIQ